MAILAQLIDDVVANRFEIKHKDFYLGRHPNNNVQIDEQAISSRHAIIKVVPNAHFPEFKEYYLDDLKSTNGTFINDVKISDRTRLHHNDVLRLAWNKFKFIDDLEGELEKTVHMLKETKS